jgi:hypothetical protein
MAADPEAWLCYNAGKPRDESDRHFRKAATDYDRKPGIKQLSCAVE